MKTISKGNIFLILAAIVWGMGLVSQQAGMDYLGPLSFTAVRCTLGGISMIPLVVVLSKSKARACGQQISQQVSGQQELSQQATVQGITAIVCLPERRSRNFIGRSRFSQKQTLY